jgi:competence protein ComEC
MAQLSRMRTSLSDFLMRSAPGDTGALLSGLVTGDDGGLTEEASDAFLSSGTTHITAISGANFAILTLLLGVMASGAMRRSLWFIGIVVGVIWLYAAMVGMQPSAMRAALLATAVLAGRWLGRIPDLLTLTVLLASMQILIRPQDFQTLAFQLSVSATVALIVVFDGSERVGGRSWLAGLALCVLAAQLATLPVLAAKLGTISGIGLLANLVVGPLASLAFPLALVGGLVGELAPWIGEVVLLPAIWLADLTVATVRWFGDHLPGSVQLGEPVPGAIVMLSAVCWLAILALSGDLRRVVRHAWSLIRNW